MRRTPPPQPTSSRSVHATEKYRPTVLSVPSRGSLTVKGSAKNVAITTTTSATFGTSRRRKRSSLRLPCQRKSHRLLSPLHWTGKEQKSLGRWSLLLKPHPSSS